MDIEIFKQRRTTFVERVLAPMTLFCLINFAVFGVEGIALQGIHLVFQASAHHELSTRVKDVSNKILGLALLCLTASATGAYIRLVLELYTRISE